MGVSWKGLTREILTRHSCVHPILTLHIPACASHMSHFAGYLVIRYLRKLFNLQLLESSHSLSITQLLQSNPTINTGYKRLNRITIKFGTELKPTKHIVVNHNFTKIKGFFKKIKWKNLQFSSNWILIFNKTRRVPARCADNVLGCYMRRLSRTLNLFESNNME